jgi:phosphopentomutase
MSNNIERPYGMVRVQWDTMMGHYEVMGMATCNDRDTANDLAARLEEAFKEKE